MRSLTEGGGGTRASMLPWEGAGRLHVLSTRKRDLDLRSCI